jgi:choline-sulfatase
MRPLVLAIGLQSLAMTAACGGRVAPPPRTNVLLVTIDTFRADRVGTGVAPTIDRLAASGIRFTSARSAVPLTLPSHATIHTGLLPPAHGVRENGTGALDETHQTIATLMRGAGYDTAAFVGAFVLDHRFGLAQGFNTYDDYIPRDPDATERLEAERPASAVVDRAIEWLERRSVLSNQPPAPSPQPPAPFFLWLHLYDPHAPYNPPKEFLTANRSAYDGEIAYADAQLARVFESLRARGEFDSTLIVVCGDHGEGLGEHGERTHGMLVYDATLRVPLVIAPPRSVGVHATTINGAVSLAEIAPTVLRAVGVAPAADMKGRDLLRAFESTVDLYSETEYPRTAGWSPLQALTDDRWVAIRAGDVTELYDVESDPRQEHDVAAAQGSVAAAMTMRAGAIHGSGVASKAATVSPDVQERLRSLGYVASSIQTAADPNAPNPAARIAVWNEFEDALSALSGHRPEAAAMLRRLAASNPGAPVIQTTWARALKEDGRLDAALAVYRQAAKRWSTDPVLLHDLAVAAREAAAAQTASKAAVLRDEAVRADEAALALDPSSAPALNGLGLLAIDAGKTDQAVTSFERATTLDSNNASYWANLGNARRAAGNRPAAEQAYRRALEVDSRTADAANGLGVLLVEGRRPAEAVAWFERAVAAAPDFPEARLNLGIALQESGQRARASEAYRQVLAAPARFKRERDAAAKLLATVGGGR